MLSKCQETDWKQFDAFAGSWDVDFTSILQQLKSTNPGVRQRARETLSQWPYEILDQIGRLGAMPSVMVCLLELLDSADVEDKAELTTILIQLVQNSEDYTSFSKWYSGSQKDLLVAVRSVFQVGTAVFLRLMADADADVRMAAANALGMSQNPDVVNELKTHLQAETNSSVRRAILLALMHQWAGAALPSILVELDSANPTSRGEAASAICEIVQPLYSRAIAALADLVMLGSDVNTVREEAVERDELRAASLAAIALSRLGPNAQDMAVNRLLAGLPDVDKNNLIEHYRRMIMVAFPTVHHEGRISADALNPAQVRILRSLVDSDSYWHAETFEDQRHLTAQVTANAEYYRTLVLREYGFPSTRKELKEFVDGKD